MQRLRRDVAHNGATAPECDVMNGNGRSDASLRALSRIGRSVGARLFLLLSASLLIVLGSLAYISLRFHHEELELATFAIAETVGNVVEKSTAHNMLRNDREALSETIRSVGQEPNLESVRIFNSEGRISFSTNEVEIGTVVSTDANACSGCHGNHEPRTDLQRASRFWIFQNENERVVSVINPIRNRPSCYEADCHAHPPELEVLGILDTTLSLAVTDQHLRRDEIRILVMSVIGLLGIVGLTGAFTWRVVHRPVEQLREATHHLREGYLGYEIPVRSTDQIGELAESFNEMSRQLHEAHQQQTDWNRILEERVQAKTDELQRVHVQMLQAEKLTSLGKLAAVVAHEINNPLSGILTYARLLRRRIERGELSGDGADEMREPLRLIEAESRRCGNLVNDLLAFSHQAPVNVLPLDLNDVIRTCVRLVEHKLGLSSISLDLQLDEALPEIHGDKAQLEQLMLALIINGVEAMTREGCLSISTSSSADDRTVTTSIADNGIGIPEEILPRLFEPFVTTKASGKGVGLGLAISKQIVDKHGGRIDVHSQVGRGTKFVVSLPVEFGARVMGASEASSESQEGDSS